MGAEDADAGIRPTCALAPPKVKAEADVAHRAAVRARLDTLVLGIMRVSGLGGFGKQKNGRGGVARQVFMVAVSSPIDRQLSKSLINVFFSMTLLRGSNAAYSRSKQGGKVEWTTNE